MAVDFPKRVIHGGTGKRQRETRRENMLDFSAISGEHKGSLTTGEIKGWLPLSKRFDFSMGVSTSFGSSDFMDTYFGVSSGDSNRSGLRRFSAHSGFRDVSFTPGVVMHLTESWKLAGRVRYMRLVGDAEDSPVTKVGDADQWIVGIGIAYAWRSRKEGPPWHDHVLEIKAVVLTRSA